MIIRGGMKPVFILFVVIHLLVDLAMPSLPGAFRFNPDESVVGVRVGPVHAQELKPTPPVDLRWEPVDLPRFELKPSLDRPARITVPDLIVLLPRRDPSPDPSAQGSIED
ncbi:MAG: hypothetical protein HY613_00985 [Candidatus Rokubacteria bacterium]|nr:hypothetical protein [Candidatus Rokubacteria bacterium]